MKAPSADKNFAAAHARFVEADKEITRLQAHSTDAVEKLLQAQLQSASIERAIEDFATNLDVNPANAADLMRQRSEAAGVIALLERAVDVITRQLAQAKAAALVAESECVIAQTEYHNDQLETMVEDFLRTNATKLQKLTLAMYQASLFANAQRNAVEPPSNYAARHVEQLVDSVLSNAVRATFGDDEAFRAGCAPSGKLKPIDDLNRSRLITNTERALARQVEMRSGRIDEIVQALMPVPPEVEDPLDKQFAFLAQREARIQAERLRTQAGYYDSRAENGPSTESMAETAKQMREAAERFDVIAETWAERIRAAGSVTTS